MTERMLSMDAMTVGRLAERFGVTVRTLHHYDRIGLLTPSGRSPSGYRLYTQADVSRLAAIVVYRRLGFGLTQVAEVLADGSDRLAHLRRQRDSVTSRLAELTQLARAIDHALEEEMDNRPATTEELRELFGGGFDDDYAAEAQERWGESDAWAQGTERTARYTKADWEEVKAEQDAVNAAFVAALTAGEPATAAVAMDAAEAHRRLIHERFYDVSYEMHRGLGQLYVEDPRFTATYEALAPGLAAYVRDAIHANADRQAEAT